jgi:hypothetical protein
MGHKFHSSHPSLFTDLENIGGSIRSAMPSLTVHNFLIALLLLVPLIQNFILITLSPDTRNCFVFLGF